MFRYEASMTVARSFVQNPAKAAGQQLLAECLYKAHPGQRIFGSLLHQILGKVIRDYLRKHGLPLPEELTFGRI